MAMSKELTESEPGYSHPEEVRVQVAGVCCGGEGALSWCGLSVVRRDKEAVAGTRDGGVSIVEAVSLHVLLID